MMSTNKGGTKPDKPDNLPASISEVRQYEDSACTPQAAGRDLIYRYGRHHQFSHLNVKDRHFEDDLPKVTKNAIADMLHFHFQESLPEEDVIRLAEKGIEQFLKEIRS